MAGHHQSIPSNTNIDITNNIARNIVTKIITKNGVQRMMICYVKLSWIWGPMNDQLNDWGSSWMERPVKLEIVMSGQLWCLTWISKLQFHNLWCPDNCKWPSVQKLKLFESSKQIGIVLSSQKWAQTSIKKKSLTSIYLKLHKPHLTCCRWLF